jgi:TRAP-type C4-dicarboxylate transport system substrate-binding protein
MNSILGSAAAALLLVSVGFGATESHAQATILFNSYEPPAGANRRVVEAWGREIERVTEGRVKLQFPPSSLAPPNQQWQVVVQGVADAAYTFNAWLQNKLLLPRVAEIPFISNSAESTAVALWRTHEKFFAPAKEYDEVVLLGFCAGPPDQLFSMSDRPINSLADLKNLKIATPPTTADRFKAVGSVPVVGPAVQLFDKVSNRIVDAVGSIAVSTAQFVNIGPYVKSVTRFPSGAYIATFSYYFSKSAWAKIPPKDQELIRSVSGEKLAQHCRLWDRMDADAYTKFREAGVPIVDASLEFVNALQRSWAYVQADWLKDAAKRKVDGAAALAYYREQVAAIEKGLKN